MNQSGSFRFFRTSVLPALAALFLFITALSVSPLGIATSLLSQAYASPSADPIGPNRAASQKKKKKNKKKGNKQGNNNVTINMVNRTFKPNTKQFFLRNKATVKVCNKDNFFHNPYSLGPAGGESFDFGEMGRECKKNTYINSSDTVQKLAFYDEIHPLEYAGFCMYPKNQRCMKGTFVSTEDDGLVSCGAEETCCSDKKDNDGDGNADCADADCADTKKCPCTKCNVATLSAAELRADQSCQVQEVCCDDQDDNDNDGLVDCDDSDCSEAAECACESEEYTGILRFETGNYGVCACYVLGFIQWDQKLSYGASSVTAVYDWTGGGPVERTETASEPYSNTYSLGEGEPTLSVPSGSNWIKILESTGVDLNTDRCAPDCATTLSVITGFVQNPRIRTTCP